LNESILFESLTEEQFEHRRKSFNEYLKSLNVIRQYQEDDYNHRSNEKTRQLEEYVDLQARIDQIRRCINEPREAFRQRFLEIERQRLQILAAEQQQQQQQRLLEEEKAKAAAAAAMVKPIKKKTSAGKKKKK
jgi:small-conductance mechanosensitive channel